MAQSKYEDARAYLDSKNYQSAVVLYKELYNAHPENKEFYQEYLLTLMALKDYKKAEELVRNRLRNEANNPLYLLDLGNVYYADKKEKKAEEQFELAIKYVNGDDILTQQMANAFSNAGNDVWAIKTYERAIQVIQIPGLYNAALAKLYNKTGDVEKAISLVIEGSQNQNLILTSGDETVEANLLELIGNDAERQQKAQKAIIKLVNLYPENFYYTYLLTWIFSVQNNWDQALIQINALERRSSDKGRLLLEFAKSAAQKNEFEVAQKALVTVVGYGSANPRFKIAREEMLRLQLAKLQFMPIPSKADIEECVRNFSIFFSEYPDAFGKPILNDYALLEAQFAANTTKGVELLKKAIDQKLGDKFFMGNCKLQLGDYYIIQGKVWDAALMYAQVDKAFREDAMGEDARFRNAKLSYYQNDFEQAQGQLSVLKASTSELIANDALFLSVLITENTPPDSNMVPLKRFAFADLLLFQNKDSEAEALLDSVAKAFPKNPLADDILLLHSKIAVKHKNFPKAIEYLKQILEQHAKDVLADDALFQIAEINRKFLGKNDEAKRLYEQLIIEYPGSSFVQQARAQLKIVPGIQ
ncbi:MAG: tetratricopeptide repeat protein [Bacteroidota bacterium]